MVSVDHAAQAAADRYSAFLALIKSIAYGAIQKTAQDAILRIPTTQLNRAAEQYLRGEAGEMEHIATALTAEASSAVQEHFGSRPAPAVVEKEATPVSVLRASLAVQANKDVQAAVSAVRSFQFTASTMARAEALDMPEAYRQAAKRDYEIGGVHVDRRNKAWKGTVYVRSLWRQAAIWVRAEATLTAIADHKQTLAVINHPEEGHASNGIIISLTGMDGYPTWGEVRDRHFHPNSRATIAPYGAEHGFPV